MQLKSFTADKLSSNPVEEEVDTPQEIQALFERQGPIIYSKGL